MIDGMAFLLYVVAFVAALGAIVGLVNYIAPGVFEWLSDLVMR